MLPPAGDHPAAQIRGPIAMDTACPEGVLHWASISILISVLLFDFYDLIIVLCTNIAVFLPSVFCGSISANGA